MRAPAPRQALDTTISLIHGPPGTGKTKELASFLLASKGRVLACAPSNRAVIELLDRFRALGRRRAVLVGVGSQVETHVTYASCRSPGSRDAARFSEILFCTLATAGRPDLRPIMGARELLVVDEAGQAIEPDVLSAAEAAQARRCVLCGDPMQLPPTVLSAAGVEAGLASSPMERLLEVRDASVALWFLDIATASAPLKDTAPLILAQVPLALGLGWIAEHHFPDRRTLFYLTAVCLACITPFIRIRFGFRARESQ